MHSTQDLGGTNSLCYALIACVQQSEQVALVSALCRHDGGLRSTVNERCHFVAIDLQKYLLSLASMLLMANAHCHSLQTCNSR